MDTSIAAADPEEPIRALLALAESKRELARREEALVRRARVRGYSWQAIAMALGVTKQAAHRRFGRS